MRIDNPIFKGYTVISGSFSGSFQGDGSRLTGITVSVDTGSLITTASSDNNTITFTKGSGDTFNLTVDTGSTAISSSHAKQADSSLFAVTASYAISASHEITYETSASYAQTAGTVEYSDITNIPSNIVSASLLSSPSQGNAVLTVNGTAGTTVDLGLQTSDHVQFHCIGVGTPASTILGEIRAAGDITAFYSSDERLKTNITPIDNGLEKISQIQGYTFDWIPMEGIHSHEGLDIGVIAQEIEKIAPQAVTTRPTGYKAVQYEKLVPLLIQAINELNTKIKNLEDVHR
jgi:hypothetical protein